MFHNYFFLLFNPGFLKNKLLKYVAFVEGIRRIVSLCIFLILFYPLSNAAQDVIPLYNGEIPGAIQGPDEETENEGVITKVSRPTLTIFLPAGGTPGKSAVIICPGGGYGSLVIDREGYNVAKAFAANGVVAFVLKYRLPAKKIMKDISLGPLQDAQEAIKKVHLLAGKYEIDTNKIGIMGFSAGGHLASTAGTHFKDANLRPAFIILVYPVISFQPGLVHEGSMHNLLGAGPTEAARKYFSNELQVTKNTPPAFLVHAADDRWVPAGNSIKFYEALRKNKVSAELHIYSKGDHGFGNYPPFEEWFGRCTAWMRINHWLPD